MPNADKNLNALTLEQIVRFAGAVQDFNPVHYDPEFARNAGLPGVIAQGPLTYLVTLDALIGQGVVDPAAGSFKVRLKAPVFANAPLALSVDAQGNVAVRSGDAEALVGHVSPREGKPNEPR